VGDRYWDKTTQDRWFFGFLTTCTVLIVLLFSPYLYVLLFAIVAATVTWPLFERILRIFGEKRRPLAAGVTMLVLTVVVFGPLSLLGWMFVNEAQQFVADASHYVEDGELDAIVAGLRNAEPKPLQDARVFVERWVPAEVLPPNQDLIKAAVDAVSKAVGTGAKQLGAAVPRILNGAFGFGLDAFLFVFALFSLYVEGPRALVMAQRLSPMDDAYEAELFGVFRELANNMVTATLVTAFIQGIVAGVGYTIVGLDSVVFLGILSGVASFVPLIGTAFVWGPVAVWVTATQGLEWGVFVAVWNLIFTGSVDNVVKPLFLRGNTQIHPLLVFMAVFGGLAWFGVPGALVGPLIVAFFLAAYTIYEKEYLGVVPEPRDDHLLPAWLRRWIAALRPSSVLASGAAAVSGPSAPKPGVPPGNVEAGGPVGAHSAADSSFDGDSPTDPGSRGLQGRQEP
jgi:predicted PurR-regulated permease PerM